jgi:drug/metabolite transporter (DMT)-like permease
MVDFAPVIIMVIATFFGASGLIFMKKGAKDFNLDIIRQLHNKSMIIGGFLFVVGMLMYMVTLRFERLSIMFSLNSLTYIWVAFLSFKILKEKISWHKWIGTFLIIAGIVLITFF